MQPDLSKEKIEEICEELKRRLSPARWDHCCRAAEIAKVFAGRAGYDENKAIAAALLHDVAREFTDEQRDEVIQKYGIRLSRYNLQFPPSIHGVVGAAIVQKEFGIDDPEILAAIRNHVSGRPCMGVLEEIVFAADHIERERKISNETANEMMGLSLDDAVYRTIGAVIEYDTKHKKHIDERSLQTFDWMLEKISGGAKAGPVIMNEEDSARFYDRLDELLDLYAEHAVSGFPAENLRDLGGYRTAEDRVIKENCIFRSGELDKLTSDDFKKLAARGINYCIDLRSSPEKKNKPDTRDCGITYVEIPFDAAGEFQSYLDILMEWFAECGDPEESAWLAARYFDSFDIDEIYLKILLDPEAPEKFKRIFEIMLSDDCTGIIFFCHSGKDRTGIIGSIIMSALGVDGNVILDDYMVSQIPYYAISLNYVNKLKKSDYGLSVQKQVFSVLGVESARPERLNKEIIARYGSYDNYFNFENMFSEDDVKRFRNKYLMS